MLGQRGKMSGSPLRRSRVCRRRKATWSIVTIAHLLWLVSMFRRNRARLTGSSETFWVDVALRNPLEADVFLNNLTLKLADEDVGGVDIEVLDDIQLGPRETRTVSSPSLLIELAVSDHSLDTHCCHRASSSLTHVRIRDIHLFVASSCQRAAHLPRHATARDTSSAPKRDICT